MQSSASGLDAGQDPAADPRCVAITVLGGNPDVIFLWNTRRRQCSTDAELAPNFVDPTANRIAHHDRLTPRARGFTFELGRRVQAYFGA